MSAPLTKTGETPQFFPLIELEDALMIPYPYDAHFFPYHVHGWPNSPRVNYGGLRQLRKEGGRLAFDVLVFDVDPPDHGKGWSANQIADWQRSTLQGLLDRLPEYYATCGWYTTRVGLRLMWELPGLDESRYLGLWAATAAKLNEAGVPVDADTADYTRCYRMPRATRRD